VGEVVLDADVVIGFLERTDAHHADAVTRLRPWLEREHCRLMAASAYAEALVRPIRRGVDRSVEEFVDVGGVEIVPMDRALARRSAQLRARHRTLRLPDAMTLATALEREAELLTFDRALRRIERAER
jgi:predicted nucleic acid-binding protein